MGLFNTGEYRGRLPLNKNLKPFSVVMFIILTTALCFSVCLIGCSNTVDIEKTINAALQASQNVRNYEASVRIDLAMNNRGQNIEVPSTVDMIVFDDPYKVKMLATSGSTPSLASESYVIKQQDRLITFTKNLNLDTWERRETQNNARSDSNLYNQAHLIELYLQNTQNFIFVGTERINGRKACKLQGVLGGKSLAHAVSTMPILPGNLFSDPDLLDDLIDKLEPMPIELWIDEANLHPVQYKMDAAGTITYILEESESPLAGTFTVSKAVLIMTLKKINQATPFDLPPEVSEDPL